MQYLRSLLYTVLMFASVIPYALAVMLCAPLPRHWRYRFAHSWCRLGLRLVEVICGLRYEVSGQQHIPAQSCVVYLKHSSVWETLAAVCVFPRQTWVLKHELTWIPIFGWALALLRPIAINRSARGSAVRQVIRVGRERLAEGLFVMIFPEGTRMAPGATRRYGLSGALLAIDQQVPLIPVAHNAGDFWPRRSLLKQKGTVKMVIGPAIETSNREPAAVNAEARQWIEKTMGHISIHHKD